MKTSRRLLLGTFLALIAAPVAFTAYTRVAGTAQVGPQQPERTPAAELAALRDFTAINVSGDIRLELSAAQDYSIEYLPISASRGNLSARVDDGTLIIEAFGNSNDLATATLRIGMPQLTRVDSEFLYSLTIRGFTTDALTLDSQVTIGDIVLENNRIANLVLDIQRTNNIELRGNTIGTMQTTHFGTTITTN